VRGSENRNWEPTLLEVDQDHIAVFTGMELRLKLLQGLPKKERVSWWVMHSWQRLWDFFDTILGEK